jgi:hypothetical protein
VRLVTEMEITSRRIGAGISAPPISLVTIMWWLPSHGRIFPPLHHAFEARQQPLSYDGSAMRQNAHSSVGTTTQRGGFAIEQHAAAPPSECHQGQTYLLRIDPKNPFRRCRLSDGSFFRF